MVGGGDGGVIRELSKHPVVQSIVQCEIDQVGSMVKETVCRGQGWGGGVEQTAHLPPPLLHFFALPFCFWLVVNLPVLQTTALQYLTLALSLLYHQEVIEVCKTYLPNMTKGYSSPKLAQYIGDGFEYMQKHNNEFDVIITDSSDPVGELHEFSR